MSIARVAANLLDLIGRADIDLLAKFYSRLHSGSATRSPLSIPGIGDLLITELQTLLIAGFIAGGCPGEIWLSMWPNLLTSPLAELTA